MASRIIFVLTAIVFVGCSNVYIKEPLIKEGANGMDERLIGKWGPFKGDSGMDEYFAVKPHPEGGMEVLLLNGAIPSEDDYFRCYAEHWSETHFLSVQVREKDRAGFLQKHGAKYALAEYEIEDDSVSVWIPTKAAIEQFAGVHPDLVAAKQSTKHKIDCVLIHQPERVVKLWENIEPGEDNWIRLGDFPLAER